jgi:hypothetical protein
VEPVIVREYKETDLAALCAIHAAQGFDYALPDLSNPLFVTKLVLMDDSHEREAHRSGQRAGFVSPLSEAASSPRASAKREENSSSISGGAGSAKIVGAALLRLTAEAYLLLDPRAGTPRERWQWLLGLHAAAERDAWQRGLEDVHAWLPPPIAEKFGKRIHRLGWNRDDSWTPYCRKLTAQP